MKRKDFINEVNDSETQDDLARPKRSRKPVNKSREDVEDMSGDEDIDLSSDDSGSYKPDEAGESDEHIDGEVAFNNKSQKPKCDKCGRNILKFSELTECNLCFEPLHENCYRTGGCRRCVVEDEFY